MLALTRNYQDAILYSHERDSSKFFSKSAKVPTLPCRYIRIGRKGSSHTEV